MARPFDTMPSVMNSRASEIGRSVTGIVRRAATAAGRTAVLSTRVDTGRARSNWVAQLNSGFTGVIAPYAPGSKLGFGEQGNASGAINQQASVISRYDATKDRAIHITNNVPYIGILNDGGANVSPDMMAQRAVSSARAVITGSKLFKRT